MYNATVKFIFSPQGPLPGIMCKDEMSGEAKLLLLASVDILRIIILTTDFVYRESAGQSGLLSNSAIRLLTWAH
jgi:hypothetical protein